MDSVSNGSIPENIEISLPDAANSVKIKRPLPKTGIWDIITAVLTFSCIYFTVYCNYENRFDYLIGAVHFAFFIFVAASAVIREKKFRREAVLPSVLLCLIFISYSLFRGYDILRMILSCYLFGYAVCAIKNVPVFPVKDTEDILFQPFALFFIPIKNVFLPIVSFFTKLKEFKRINNRKLAKTSGIILGIILAVPVFLIASELLSDADIAFYNAFSAVFQKLFNSINKLTKNLSFNLDNIIPTLFFTPFVFSFIFCAGHGITKTSIEEKKRKNSIKRLGVINSYVIFGFYSVISILYVIFLFSQLTYLFSAFSGTPAYGYSLSTYARQGFFEMSAVAVLNLGLIALGAIFSKRNSKGGLPKISKYFSLFFCLFTVLLIIIAASKMVLYVSGLGLTEKRIAVLTADAVLLITFICISVKLFKNSFPCLKTVSSAAVIAVSFLLIFSANSLASGFNTGMYLTGHHNQIDILTIKKSDSIYVAATALDKLSESDDTATAKKAQSQLYMLYDSTKEYIKRVHTLDTYLFGIFAEENKDRILSFKPSDTKDSFTVPVKHLQSEQNYTESVIILTLNLPESVKKIKIENTLLTKELQNSDFSPFTFGQDIYIYDWFSLDSDGSFAVITLYLENGEKHIFELRKDNEFTEENKERSYNIEHTDYFSGEFKVKETGYIYLVRTSY